ncbi:NUDIX hydrolase [Desulfovermiculus halophilus]|jgi:8-oxo-dGTP pyrophosphatase MutT (NUDIX family)|uniref:NUDIX hydrolase n=1 Tax=Desulfovermiculus halophilus TaxID=339722 RepID=UPI000481F6FC|nr:NUDIX domain-containing protein [Desulfovermiculus halophilus]
MKHQDLEQLRSRLPRHPNIMGKSRYLNAAVLIPLIEVNREYSFLFQKRAAHIRQGGEVSFPGGEFEPENDQSCREAALREAEEELGISRDRIHILGRLDKFISARGVTVDSFVATLDLGSLDDLHPDRNEVERLFMLPVSFFEHHPACTYELELEIKPWSKSEGSKEIEHLPVDALGLPARYKKPWPGLAHRVLVYQTPEEVVWGLTAELVNEVITLLHEGTRAPT